MKYGATIQDLAFRGNNWRFYDENCCSVLIPAVQQSLSTRKHLHEMLKKIAFIRCHYCYMHMNCVVLVTNQFMKYCHLMMTMPLKVNFLSQFHLVFHWTVMDSGFLYVCV